MNSVLRMPDKPTWKQKRTLPKQTMEAGAFWFLIAVGGFFLFALGVCLGSALS